MLGGEYCLLGKKPMLAFNRWLLFKILAATLCVVGLTSLLLIYFIPAPQATVTIATAPKGGYFEYYGHRYQQIFARAHVNLDVRLTKGSPENLNLLKDRTSGVQVGFVAGGISDGKHEPELLSLGTIQYFPFWIFYSSIEPIDRLSQLKGKRIAVGPVGSGTRQQAERILGIADITSKNATLLPFANEAAVDALRNGNVDVVFILGTPNTPAIEDLLRIPGVRLMSFPRAEAFTRIFPDLVRLVLPEGVIDFNRNIPPNDVTLLGTATRVLVRSDLHPGIVNLLLQTMVEAHGEAGIFQRAGEFPIPSDPEYPMAASALDFYKSGPSFLQRHLPLWTVTHVQRLFALSLAAAAICFPLFNFAPRLYGWFSQIKINNLYCRLRAVEKELQAELAVPRLVALQTDLENIDHGASILPMRHSDLFFLI